MEEECTEVWSEPVRLSKVEGVALSYPLIATPLGSGIRFITDNCGVPRDISGNAVVNDHVRGEIEEYGMDGLDGLIQLRGSYDHHKVWAELNERKGKLDFEYFIQDVSDTGLTYRERCDLTKVVPTPRPPWLKLAESVTVYDAEGVELYWQQVGLYGFVGVTLKTPGRRYTTGSSPLHSMEHIVYEKWEKGIATAVGFTGTGNRLDYITCIDPDADHQFNIEGGFSPKQRTDIWRDRQVYNKFKVRYAYQPLDTSVPLNARFKKISKR